MSKKTDKITIAVSSRGPMDSVFRQNLDDSCGVEYELLWYENNGSMSLTQVYNRALEDAQNDIIVLSHDDIIFPVQNWGQRLIQNFNDTEYGILGFAGAQEYGTYEQNPDGPRVLEGWWIYESKDCAAEIYDRDYIYNPFDINIIRINEAYQTECRRKWMPEPMVILDEMCLCINRKRLNFWFDENVIGITAFGADICLQNCMSGCNVGIIRNFTVIHRHADKVFTDELGTEQKINYDYINDKYSDRLPVKLVYKFLWDEIAG